MTGVVDVALGPFVGATVIKDERKVGGLFETRVEVGDGCLGEGFDRLASGFPGSNAAIREPGDAVEADAAEFRDGFRVLAGVVQDEDEVVGGKPAGSGEEVRAETERNGAGDVAFTERLLAAAIDDEGAELGAGGDVFRGEGAARGEGFHGGDTGLVDPFEVRVIGGGERHSGENDGNELVLRLRAEGVVEALFVADGGGGRVPDLAAAGRSGGVAGVDDDRIREVGQGFGDGGIELAGEVVGLGFAEEVGAADFTDEEGITGEEGDRFGLLGGIDEQVGEVFRSVAGGGKGAEDEGSDGDFVAGVERGVRELLLAEAAAVERCAGGGVITRG
jgi:hypothetical protein